MTLKQLLVTAISENPRRFSIWFIFATIGTYEHVKNFLKLSSL